MRAFTSNRDGMESHLSRKLHNQVPKAANTLYSDQVSSAQPGIAKSVISGDSAQSSGASSTELSSSGNATDIPDFAAGIVFLPDRFVFLFVVVFMVKTQKAACLRRTP